MSARTFDPCFNARKKISSTNSNWLKQKELLKSNLDNSLENTKKCIFLDYPINTNIGDLLLYRAALEWMKSKNLAVLGHWHMENFNSPVIHKDTTILLQGGGNFGDLYRHQNFREEVVTQYPDNRIILLPQTMHFEQSNNLIRAASIFNNHRDLHLHWRDNESYTDAVEYFNTCHNHLTPDMATFLFPLQPQTKENNYNSGKEFFILRQDKESLKNNPMIEQTKSVWSGDWKQILGPQWYVVKLFQLVSKVGLSRLFSQHYARIWEYTAKRLVSSSLKKLNGAKLITTDRLHGYISSNLLEIPFKCLDNNYGKIKRYQSTWEISTNNSNSIDKK